MSNDSGALLELVELQDESKPHQEKKNNEGENKDISLEPRDETKSNFSLSTTRSRIIVVAALLILMTAIIFGSLFGFLGNRSFERPGSKVPNPIQCNTSTEWACLDGITCIDTGLRCDGFQDCPMNGEDEQGCSATCRDYQFDCGNGVCIANHFHCFAGDNCPNGEDEMNCTHTGSCLPGYFGCTDGTCIPEHQRCNYFIDCPDRSDELPELCGRCNAENEYECYLGNCIPLYWQCDGYQDCVDGEDELHCAYTHGSETYKLEVGDSLNISSPNWPLPPLPGQYMQWNISGPAAHLLRIDILEINLGFQAYITFFKHDICLNLPECSENMFFRKLSDTSNIHLYMIVNASRLFVTYHAGIFVNHRDLLINVQVLEPSETIFPECTSQYITCMNDNEQYCISSDHLCGIMGFCRVENCMTAHYECEGSTKTIQSSQRCNYAIDCPNLDDELNCTCAETDFVCNSGQCIPSYFVCDFYYDCFDGNEDEINCATENNTYYVTLKETQMFTIHSPNYPLNYPPEAYEVYYIIAPVGYRAAVTFNHFVIDWKGFLSLGSGNDVNDHGSIFAVFGHHDNPTTVYVPSLQFFVEFHGGPYGRSRGFEASIHVIKSGL